MTDEEAYILGTDREELFRLGVQHQVWASEAQKGWKLAGFKAGQTLLDLGCGPGFSTKELAFLVGNKGKVLGVDISQNYLNYLDRVTAIHQLPIETITADFDDMDLSSFSLDGMYCRWALAWHSNPTHILMKVRDALKPGGKMVIHEYYDWSTHQTEPSIPGLTKAIACALKSFKDLDSEINIGREIPEILLNLGMKVVNVRLMSKLATPTNAVWDWPKSFYHSYFPRLVEMNYLKEEEARQAIEDISKLENTPGATLCCPLMIEIIAEK